MSTITTLLGTDAITTADSMTKINANFNALNADKVETSAIDTDTALTANSDAKIPSQKAVKAYVDAGGNVNASTTTKGIVEEATQAEVNAGTATGATGARLFVNPSTMSKVITSVIPLPMAAGGMSPAGVITTTDTVARVGLIHVPYSITVNKVSIRTAANVSTSPLDMTLYSYDGQTRLFAVSSSASPAASSVISATVSSIYLTPGYYWFMVNTDTATLMQVYAYNVIADIPFSTTEGLLSDVAGKQVLSGQITITSGTPPSSLTLSSITESLGGTVVCRFDN